MNELFQHIPGSSLDWCNYRDVLSAEGVQETGLPRIWLTSNHKLHTLLYYTAMPRPRLDVFEAVHDRLQFAGDLLIFDEIDFFLGKIDSSFYQYA